MRHGIPGVRVGVTLGLLVGLQMAHPASALQAQSLPRLEQSAVIGCLACEGAEAFGAIQAIAVGPGGGVVVADRDAPMIRSFDAQGRLTASFGRRGEGPGELGMPAGIAVRPDGRVLIGDIRRLHLTELTAEGEVVRTLRVPSTVMGLNGAPGGDWVAYQIANWSDFTATVHLLDEASDSAGTPLPTTGGVIADQHGSGAAAGLLSSAAGPGGVVAVGYGGLEYRILILDRAGAKQGEIVRDIPRTPRTPQEIRDLEEIFRRGPGGAARADNPEAGATPRPVDPLRPHYPSRALSWDAKGRLWVRTSRGTGETLFDLFDPSGSWLGELAVPGEVRTHATGQGVLATVVSDPATEVQRVVVWRVIG